MQAALIIVLEAARNFAVLLLNHAESGADAPPQDSGGQPIMVSCSFMYRFVKDQIPNVLQNFAGDGIHQSKLNEKLNSQHAKMK